MGDVAWQRHAQGRSGATIWEIARAGPKSRRNVQDHAGDAMVTDPTTRPPGGGRGPGRYRAGRGAVRGRQIPSSQDAWSERPENDYIVTGRDQVAGRGHAESAALIGCGLGEAAPGRARWNILAAQR